MRQIVLLRGINLGPRRRVPMADLRAELVKAGFHDARTYLQSGNVVLWSDAGAEELVGECERLIEAGFGFPVQVVVRSRDELAEVVRRDPLGSVATNPKRYQVSFLSDQPGEEIVRQLASLALPSEQLVSIGRELYAWHPDGVARSKLWAKLAGQGLGVTATARNWSTVTGLLELAEEQ